MEEMAWSCATQNSCVLTQVRLLSTNEKEKGLEIKYFNECIIFYV